jgi:hypothetical protein
MKRLLWHLLSMLESCTVRRAVCKLSNGAALRRTTIPMSVSVSDLYHTMHASLLC